MSAIAKRFESIAARYSGQVAVKSGDRSLTYRELDRQAEALACRVRSAVGVGAGEKTGTVGLLLEHGVDLAIGALACLKAGCIHVPLDLGNPAERLAAILGDARARFVVKMQSTPLAPLNGVGVILADDPAESAPPGEPYVEATAAEVAFLLYTSGSTGVPKGVVYRHESVVVRVADFNRFGVGPGDRITALGSGGMNMYRALLTGATLVALNLREVGIDALPQWLAAERITIYHSVPTVLRRLMASLRGRLDLPDLRVVNITGETLLSSDVEMFRKFFPEQCELVNGLGTTEAGTFRELRIRKDTQVKDGPVPAGHAIEGTEVLLLAADGRVIEDDGIGEIVVVGDHLAAGYWQQPAKTAERFFTVETGDPPIGRGTRRAYRTGDFGQLLPDGSLLHLGREDFQVKIRGHRVEVGDVEVACRKHPAVREVAVVGHADSAGVTRLCCYVVPQPEATLDPRELLPFLREQLPEYMVPGSIEIIAELPVTPSGKVDRLALPHPSGDGNTASPTHVAPQNDIEARLLNWWREVLQVESLSTDDDFFALGGDSLSAARVVARIYSELRIEMPASTVFRAPTIIELARKIAEHRA